MTVKFFIIISLPQMKNNLYFDLMQKLNNCLARSKPLPPTTEPETPPTTEPETPPTTEPSGKNEVIYRYPETGEVITTQEYEVGEKIVPPTPPTDYVWGYYPDDMPDRNVFVDALPDVIDF